MTKVMKFELVYLDGGGNFHDLQKILWEFQKNTRAILNKTIQEKYCETLIGKDFYTESRFKRFCHEFPDMSSYIVNAPINEAEKKYKNSKYDVNIGAMSLPSYRQDQPIRFQKKGVRIVQDDGQFIALFSLFSDGGYKKAHPGVDRPRFRIKVCDNTQKAIVERIVSGEYVLGLCQLAYERPKWFLSATYEFEPEKKVLDNSKILGVDLGCVNAIYASSYGQHGYFKIPGDEISAFEIKQATMQNRKPMSTLNRVEKLEEDRYAKQLQARYCGDGRIGHGIKTRVAPAYAVSDKIARFRDTINHRYSRALVDYAVKNGYGTIQMEDLSGIKDNTDFPKRLRHWTYFDLQTKIKYKAEENGIKVIKVNPEFTSQRCSRCGCIDERNRTTQSDFKCIACGAKMNADYNASQNLSIMDIDKLIKSSKATTANAKLTCESN